MASTTAMLTSLVSAVSGSLALAVMQADGVHRVGEWRVVPSDGSDGMEDLRVMKAILHHVQQKLPRDGACREFLFDQKLAEQ